MSASSTALMAMKMCFTSTVAINARTGFIIYDARIRKLSCLTIFLTLDIENSDRFSPHPISWVVRLFFLVMKNYPLLLLCRPV